MPRIISFAWTTPALLAGAKTVTRRDWKANWAAQFLNGDIVFAYNRSQHLHGTPVARLRLTQHATWEADARAPDSDYEAEGFAFLEAHPDLLPKAARGKHRMTLTHEAFNRWRQAGGFSWVVRFDVIEILAPLTLTAEQSMLPLHILTSHDARS